MQPVITFSWLHVSSPIREICEFQYKISHYITHLFAVLHYSKTREDPGVRSRQNLTVSKSQPLQNLCLLQIWLATEQTVGHCRQKCVTGPVLNYESNFFVIYKSANLWKFWFHNAFRTIFSEEYIQQNYFFTLLIQYVTETGQTEPAFFWSK
jgi:hypothetical protein